MTTSPDFANKRIVIAMTGGVACYKVAELVRRLQDHGATVDVVMTEAATHFITAITMQALSGRHVFVDAWDSRPANNMAHINLSRGADAILVAPASADFMSKLAHGAADDLASTLCIARACPLLVAPAMNREMWLNPATQRNVAQLREDGIKVLGPAAGSQACGETGDGRMLEPEQLLAELSAFFQPKILAGKRVLVTAGPTSEPIDPVRVLTNLSSGKMGYAIARAAAEAGADVCLVSGPTALPAPHGVQRIDVQSARDMLQAVQSQLSGTDIFIAVAAVADWRVSAQNTEKMKKTKNGPPALALVENPDILATVARRTQGRPGVVVGFAAETEKIIEHGQAKLARKGCDLIVANDVSPGTGVMGGLENSVHFITASAVDSLPRQDKKSVARAIVARCGSMLKEKSS